jgi:glycine cleavage system protein P-like pyridoxal-binding family
MADETSSTMVEPTDAEVQQALERLRKQKAYRKEYQEKKKEKLAEDPNASEEEKAKRKAYFETHKAEIYEKRKAYYEKNKEKVKEYHKRYHEKNKLVMDALRAKAKESGMKLEQYLESIS